MTGRPGSCQDTDLGAFAQEVRRDLLMDPPRLQPKYFYDTLGSALFDAICALPWYTITRAEIRMLAAHAATVVGAAAAPVEIVELGCGSGEKLVTLLGPVRSRVAGVHLVDISAAALESTRRRLELDGVRDVVCHQAPFEYALETLAGRPGGGRPLLLLFLGSNIGNFAPDEATAFLARLVEACRPGDRLLLGVDLVKPAATLIEAYDDPLGVTAAFNLNILLRLNRELEADFDLAGFRHRAVWNDLARRVEMHLVSRHDQRVRIPRLALQLDLAPGQYIWTESSYKYEAHVVRERLAQAGMACERQWVNDVARFSLTLGMKT